MISLICQVYKQKTKHQAYRKRQDLWLQEVAGVGGMWCGGGIGGGWSEAHTSSYKINKY